MGELSIGVNLNPLTVTPKIGHLKITAKRQHMEQHFELIGAVQSLQLQMHQNIQLIRIKTCQLKNCEHIGGLSPAICGLFMLALF